MSETQTIWICPDCVEIVAEGGVPADATQGPLPRIAPGSLVTLGFRNVDDHHVDCDLRNSVNCGDHGYDCNISCEEWDGCPYDCHACGSGADRYPRRAATLWPALVGA